MTAPEMVEGVAEVLLAHVAEQTTGHYRNGGKWEVLCSCGHVSKYDGNPDFDDAEHAAHQARAVLDALAKAGTVEWGTMTPTGRVRIRVPDEDTARLLAAPHERVVSRLTLPWTKAVE